MALRKREMKKNSRSLVLLTLILPLMLGIFASSAQAAINQSSNRVFLGLSGYPTSTGQIDNIIDTMQANGLNTYRMSANPAWSGGPHPYHREFIQYFLANTPSNWVIIVDRNHLYPPTEASATSARDNWASVRNSLFEVLQAYPNNPRVIVELINEYISSDFYSRMQSLVTEIRSAGYTNPLLVNKWNQPWTAINDPIDDTYQGYHFYFNSWSPSGALSQMNTAQSKGIKVINTEIGADFNEYSSFTTSTVDELNQFLSQCASMGMGNTVWMNENLNNMPRYNSLGIDFPTVASPQTSTTTPPPTPTPTPSTNPTATPTPTNNPSPNPELNYPTQTWQRLWTTPEGQYIGQLDETTLQFDNNWGSGTVAFGRTDDIMFTSSRTITLSAGTYTFTVGSDDGFRLYIDNQQVMQNWGDHSYQTDSYTTTLTQGSHSFRLDFYENSGSARASFAYQAQTTTTPTPTPTPTSTPQPTQPPTSNNNIFEDGFESADLSKWSGTTVTSQDSVTTRDLVPYDGDHHARFYTTGSSRSSENAYLRQNVNLQKASVTGQFYFSSSSILRDNYDRLYLIRLRSSNGDIAMAGIRRENGVNKWMLYTNGIQTSSVVNIDAGEYQEVTLQWNAAQRTAELYVNGQKILESNTNSYTAVTRVDMGIISTYRVQNSLIVYGDNFTISS